MGATEIGHSAAYEAYRTWIHNSSIYEPLSGDVERQREGLVGLAVAEGAISLLTPPLFIMRSNVIRTRNSCSSYSVLIASHG